ncbi:MAG TPA: DUF4038 domain-containing protein [Planctomycetota bacterium]|nr:DUF4038 domain-containing protein [Planctomycetota bacterium]
MHAGKVNSVATWTIAEIALTSGRAYANPFADAAVTAVFSHGDRRIERSGFWDGGSAWKIRFAPPEPGEWRWETACSDRDNTGLHGLMGMLRCVPYEGENPNYRHGFVKASPNRRYFVRADGTPFFWLGDTHWQMADWERLHENNAPDAAGRSQFHQLVADRATKGFTVYQNYFAGHLRHWWRDDHYACIEPTRFREVMDPMLNHLAARGFVIAQGIGLYNTSLRVPRESLVRLARYVAARYGAHPLVWFTAQEVNLPPREGKPTTDLDSWAAAAAAFAAANGYGHPVGGHMYPGRPTVWGKEPWHTWFPLQGGHTNSGPRTQADYRFYWDYQPRKPFVETEAMYEQIICGPRKATADDVRHVAWKALLSGSYGFTYGAAAVWLLKWDKADRRGHGYNPNTWWHEGMNLPGSAHMRHLRHFFTAFGWWKLEPRFADPAWCRFAEPEATVLATEADRRAVVYAYGTKRSIGSLHGLTPATAYATTWFDPRTGSYREAPDLSATKAGALTLPDKPDGEDWVLMLVRREEG